MAGGHTQALYLARTSRVHRLAPEVKIAAMVVWMLSEENSFTTAATFDLSGGRTTY